MSSEARAPRHIAIIMDGNGRWAHKRGLPRIEGHRRGIESVRAVVTELARRGDVDFLTLYAFSTENWARPKREVSFLMRLLKRFCRQELKLMMDNSIRFTTIGALTRIPADVREELRATTKKTAANTGLTLCLALNYGARDEITRAARRAAREAAAGDISPAALTEERLSALLDTADMPDPDLLIRTAGEKRLSNFLLWQASYAELYFTRTLWPDFREKHINRAISSYAKRTRKYGTIEEG
jgi:undecaprenyl diphosphate synthase